MERSWNAVVMNNDQMIKQYTSKCILFCVLSRLPPRLFQLGGGASAAHRFVYGEQMDSNEVDIVENGAIVKVFLLEGALPDNAPADVREAAGPFWDDFGMYRLQVARLQFFAHV